ncbi:hypothetical protein DFH06DRAFT_1139510 [Mycena polygramma]|nr:hypothetical protein DFH06DRAFT_1139510 [Mycena polygramma]
MCTYGTISIHKRRIAPGSLPCARRGRWVLLQARDDLDWLNQSAVRIYTPCVTVCIPSRSHGALRTSVCGQPAPVVAGYSSGMALGDAADAARFWTPASPGTALLRATDAWLAQGPARSASLGVQPPVRASRARAGASNSLPVHNEFEGQLGTSDKRNSVAGNRGIVENGRLAWKHVAISEGMGKQPERATAQGHRELESEIRGGGEEEERG